MNILVFSWRDPRHPLAGGAEQIMHEHMKGWSRAGHEITLFSSRFKGSIKEEWIDSIKVVRGGSEYLGVQLMGMFFYLKNREKFSLVIDQFHGIPFFTPLYVDKPKLAVIQEIAQKVWFLNPLVWPLNWLVGGLGFIFEPLAFLFYKKVKFMTGSASAKKDVVGFGIPENNIVIVHHGVVLDHPKKFPRKEKLKTVCYLGVLSRDKGIEDAIKCFKLLNRGDFQFWVIGKPDTERYGLKLKALVKKSIIGDKVKFWGFVSQDEKFKLLARSHVLINPSKHEGWGLVNIEANSVSTPTVAYKSAGLEDSVKDGFSGIFTSENTPQALVEAILYLFDNPVRFKELQKNSKKWSQQFDWKKSSQESLELIESLRK